MDEQQTPSAGTPIYQESQEKNAKWLWLLIVLIIVSALGFAYWKQLGPFAQFRLGAKQEASPTPSASPFTFSSPSPESSPEASLDKSGADVRVLNGTTTTGLAASVKDFLEGKGYKVSSIGNAVSKDFTKTVIKFKAGFENFEESLVSDLSNKYSVTVDSETLEATDAADIEVVVGTK